eukprot:1161228-Pelagomonas_calceolata.AAC.5
MGWIGGLAGNWHTVIQATNPAHLSFNKSIVFGVTACSRSKLAEVLLSTPASVLLLDLSCWPPATPHPTLFIPPCRAKKQLTNTLARSWNGAVGAEMCFLALNGRFLPRKGWASHGGDQG